MSLHRTEQPFLDPTILKERWRVQQEQKKQQQQQQRQEGESSRQAEENQDRG